MYASRRVDESASVIHGEVGISMTMKVSVASPAVCKDGRPWVDMLLYQSKESVVVPSVIRALCQETISCLSTATS